MQLGLPLKQVGSLIRCSKLKVSVKCCQFLSSGVMLKSPNNVMFSYPSRYLERFFDIFSINKELFWLGGLYKPTMSHFFNCMFISRYMASVSLSKCKFNYLSKFITKLFTKRCLLLLLSELKISITKLTKSLFYEADKTRLKLA